MYLHGYLTLYNSSSRTTSKIISAFCPYLSGVGLLFSRGQEAFLTCSTLPIEHSVFMVVLLLEEIVGHIDNNFWLAKRSEFDFLDVREILKTLYNFICLSIKGRIGSRPLVLHSCTREAEAGRS